MEGTETGQDKKTNEKKRKAKKRKDNYRRCGILGSHMRILQTAPVAHREGLRLWHIACFVFSWISFVVKEGRTNSGTSSCLDRKALGYNEDGKDIGTHCGRVRRKSKCHVLLLQKEEVDPTTRKLDFAQQESIWGQWKRAWEGKRPAATCKFKLDECSGTRRDFCLGCSNALAASTACEVTDRLFPPHFSLFSIFGIDGWSAEVSCSMVSQPLWPACWIDTLDRSSSSVSRAVQDVWDVYRMSWRLYLLMCFLLSGMRCLGLLLMIFGPFGATMRKGVFLERPVGPVVSLRPATLPFQEEVCYVFVAGVWEVELLVAVVLVANAGGTSAAATRTSISGSSNRGARNTAAIRINPSSAS